MGEGWCPVLLHSSVFSCGAASSALQPDKSCDKCKYFNQRKMIAVFNFICSFTLSLFFVLSCF